MAQDPGYFFFILFFFSLLALHYFVDGLMYTFLQISRLRLLSRHMWRIPWLKCWSAELPCKKHHSQMPWHSGPRLAYTSIRPRHRSLTSLKAFLLTMRYSHLSVCGGACWPSRYRTFWMPGFRKWSLGATRYRVQVLASALLHAIKFFHPPIRNGRRFMLQSSSSSGRGSLSLFWRQRFQGF